MTGCTLLLWREADDLGATVRRLDPTVVAVSAGLAVAGNVCIQRAWHTLLVSVRVSVDRRDATAVFYVTQLGKYIPGSVWPVVAQVELGARWGASRRVMLGASVLLLTMVTTTGILVGAVLLPWASPEGLRRFWWLLLLLPPLAATLHPRVVTSVIDRLLQLMGREPLRVQPSGNGLARAAVWASAAWVVFGGHLLILMSAFGPVGAIDAAAAVGGIALAWAAGIAFIPAPAGAGVREGVLLLALGPHIGTDAAVTVALASRVLLIVADVALAGFSSAWQARRRISVSE